MSAAAALVVAAALAGCGSTTYFAGRVSAAQRAANRVLIAIQNPSASCPRARCRLSMPTTTSAAATTAAGLFSISGFGGALPITIQNMPEEQFGAVYGSGDGSFTWINYARKRPPAASSGLNGLSSSIFITRNQAYVFAASQASHVLTVVNQSEPGQLSPQPSRRLPRQRESRRLVALAFVQNSNYVYYPRKLTPRKPSPTPAAQAPGPRPRWTASRRTRPLWCLFQAQSPDHMWMRPATTTARR
jgi:hypothetical protein